MNTGRQHQIPRKANQSLGNEIGQRIKMKSKTEDFRTEIYYSSGGRGDSQNPEKGRDGSATEAEGSSLPEVLGSDVQGEKPSPQ